MKKTVKVGINIVRQWKLQGNCFNHYYFDIAQKYSEAILHAFSSRPDIICPELQNYGYLAFEKMNIQSQKL
jgi:hypothetical protein